MAGTRSVLWLWGIPLLSMASSGCSALLLKGAPLSPDEQSGVDCTDDYAAPVLDTVVWGAGMAVAAYQASRGNSVALATGGGVLWAASAAYGYGSVHRCNALKEKVAEEGSYRKWVSPGLQPRQAEPPAARAQPMESVRPASAPPGPAVLPAPGYPIHENGLDGQ
jgi:hypothetical protein